MVKINLKSTERIDFFNLHFNFYIDIRWILVRFVSAKRAAAAATHPEVKKGEDALNTWNLGDEWRSFHFLAVVLDDDVVDAGGHGEERDVAFVPMVLPGDISLGRAIYLNIQFTCN